MSKQKDDHVSKSLQCYCFVPVDLEWWEIEEIGPKSNPQQFLFQNKPLKTVIYKQSLYNIDQL